VASAHVIDLGLVPYTEAWDLQRTVADEVAEGKRPDTILLLEHPPTITTGRRTEESELHIPPGAEVEVVETDRGGKSTFHGPGQLVCYPIFDLKRHGQDVKRYCRDLEEALILTLRSLGLEGERIDGLTGVWLTGPPAVPGASRRERSAEPGSARQEPSAARGGGPPRKIASIGIHVSKWVTTHGYALNVDLDPAPFTQWITACGLEDAMFTTIAKELGRPVSVDDVRGPAADALAEVFRLTLEEQPALATR
jgi:lipoyl(octanoyl) transferase